MAFPKVIGDPAEPPSGRFPGLVSLLSRENAGIVRPLQPGPLSRGSVFPPTNPRGWCFCSAVLRPFPSHSQLAAEMSSIPATLTTERATGSPIQGAPLSPGPFTHTSWHFLWEISRHLQQHALHQAPYRLPALLLPMGSLPSPQLTNGPVCETPSSGTGLEPASVH